jgi:hypothetical protein
MLKISAQLPKQFELHTFQGEIKKTSDLGSQSALSPRIEKRKRMLEKLNRARDEMRNYLRFMMFFLSPEKLKQLQGILSRLESLIDKGAAAISMDSSNSDTSRTAVQLGNSEQLDDRFMRQSERAISEMRRALNEPRKARPVPRWDLLD